MLKAFFSAILVMILVLALIYFIFPLLGGVVIAGGMLIWLVAGSVIGFVALIMAMFIVGGVAVLALAGIGAVWLLLALIFLPISFPILFPLFVLALFITYAHKNRRVIPKNDEKL